MENLENLNKSIDDTLYLPYNLPIHEYILMPNSGSLDFGAFQTKYIQSHGENLDDFKDKLEPYPVYAVFKTNSQKIAPYYFKPVNELKKQSIL